MLYPKMRYKMRVHHDSSKGVILAEFEHKPETVVFELLRAVGFKPSANETHLKAIFSQELYEFAVDLALNLEQGCLPERIPYVPEHPKSSDSLDSYKFTVATVHYINQKSEPAVDQFVIFEKELHRREGFSRLIAWIKYGDNVRGVFTPYRRMLKEARVLFKEGKYEVALPFPFGEGCKAEYERTQEENQTSFATSSTMESAMADTPAEIHDRKSTMVNPRSQIGEGEHESELTKNEHISDDESSIADSPAEIYYSESAMVNPPERIHDGENAIANAKEETKHGHLAANQAGTFQVPENIAERIPVKTIQVTGEGFSWEPEYDKGGSFSTWKEANEYVATLVGEVPDAYFLVTWTDGETFSGKFDLEPDDDFKGKPDLLSKRLDYYFWRLSEMEPDPIYTPKAIAHAQKLLAKYAFIDRSDLSTNDRTLDQEHSVDPEISVETIPESQFSPSEQIAPIQQPYTSIYRKLHQLIPNLVEEMERGVTHHRSSSEGFMDAIFEYLYKDEEGRYIISLAHYYEQNGDLIPDPDMEIRVDPVLQTAEALIYKDTFGFKEVYSTEGDKITVNHHEKKSQNTFLKQWLKNMVNQGHLFLLSEIQIQTEDHGDSENKNEAPLLTSDEKLEELVELYHQAIQSRDWATAHNQLNFLTLIITGEYRTEWLTKLFEFADHSKIRSYLNRQGFSLHHEMSNKEWMDHLDHKLWSYIPDSFKAPRLPKPLNWEPYKANPGLINLVKFFVSSSQEQPSLMGVLFDAEGIMATDAHKLLFLAHENKGKLGLYCLTKACWENHKSKTWNEVKDNLQNLVDNDQAKLPDNSPSYKQIIRTTHDRIVTLSVPHYFELISAILKARLVLPGAPHLYIKIEQQFFGVNPYYLLDLFKTWLHLGIEEVDLGFAAPDRPLFFSQVGQLGSLSSMEHTYMILMPIKSNEPEKGQLYLSTDSHSMESIGFEARELSAVELKTTSSEGRDPIISITLNLKVEGDELRESFKSWEEVQHYLVRLTPPEDGDSIPIQYMINWQHGPAYEGRFQLYDWNTNPAMTEQVLGTHILSNFLLQKHEAEKRLPGAKGKPNHERIKVYQNWIETLDFGLDVAVYLLVHPLKIPIHFLKIDLGNAVFTTVQPWQDWQHFDKAGEELDKARSLFGLTEDISITAEWMDGKRIHKTIQPIVIPSTIDRGFWARFFADDLGNKKPDYQCHDNEALLFEHELDMPSDATYLVALLPAYWQANDNTFEERIAVANGRFHQGRLHLELTTLFNGRSILKQEELILQLMDQFAYDKPFKQYEKSILTPGKEGDARQTILRQVFFEDVLSHHETILENPIPLYEFLVGELALSQGEVVDLPTEVVSSKENEAQVELATIPEIKGSKKRYQLNKEIEALIDKKTKDNGEYTEEEKQLIQKYSGWGGLSDGTENKGLLYEYYTPDFIIQKMWALAYQFGYRTGDVLEPSAGIGRFLKYASPTSRIVAFETSSYSAKICEALHPYAKVYERPFESIFFQGNQHLKDDFKVDPFDLVIGNPPYGVFEGKYAGMGEKKHTKAKEYDHYFLTRGLDLLKPEGLLVYIISSGFLDSQKAYTEVKKRIATKAELLVAYRLPNGIFDHTTVGTDIVVFKKRKI